MPYELPPLFVFTSLNTNASAEFLSKKMGWCKSLGYEEILIEIPANVDIKEAITKLDKEIGQRKEQESQVLKLKEKSHYSKEDQKELVKLLKKIQYLPFIQGLSKIIKTAPAHFSINFIDHPIVKTIKSDTRLSCEKTKRINYILNKIKEAIITHNGKIIIYLNNSLDTLVAHLRKHEIFPVDCRFLEIMNSNQYWNYSYEFYVKSLSEKDIKKSLIQERNIKIKRFTFYGCTHNEYIHEIVDNKEEYDTIFNQIMSSIATITTTTFLVPPLFILGSGYDNAGLCWIYRNIQTLLSYNYKTIYMQLPSSLVTLEDPTLENVIVNLQEIEESINDFEKTLLELLPLLIENEDITIHFLPTVTANLIHETILKEKGCVITFVNILPEESLDKLKNELATRGISANYCNYFDLINIGQFWSYYGQFNVRNLDCFTNTLATQKNSLIHYFNQISTDTYRCTIVQNNQLPDDQAFLDMLSRKIKKLSAEATTSQKTISNLINFSSLNQQPPVDAKDDVIEEAHTSSKGLTPT